MKAWELLYMSLIVCTFITVILAAGPLTESAEDNDFAEFEDSDDGNFFVHFYFP